MPGFHVFKLLAALIFIAVACAAGTPALAEKINLEVQASSVERDPKTRDVVVTIELSPEAKTAFENYTQRNVGRSIEIRVGTTVLLKARLAEKISGGTIRATTKFNEEEGKKVSAQLKRGTLITLEDVAE